MKYQTFTANSFNIVCFSFLWENFLSNFWFIFNFHLFWNKYIFFLGLYFWCKSHKFYYDVFVWSCAVGIGFYKVAACLYKFYAKRLFVCVSWKWKVNCLWWYTLLVFKTKGYLKKKLGSGLSNKREFILYRLIF